MWANLWKSHSILCSKKNRVLKDIVVVVLMANAESIDLDFIKILNSLNEQHKVLKANRKIRRFLFCFL